MSPTVARAAIAAYQPLDPREAAFRERMLSLLQLSAPLSRGHFTPGHLTASAFVVSPDDELLLIFHRKLGIWVQPGGHIEPGDESLLDAARREVAEEVGLDLGGDPSEDVVRLAGGAGPVAARARAVAASDPALALRLTSAALAAEPTNKAALTARKQALEALLARSKNSNESGWLNAGLAKVEAALK